MSNPLEIIGIIIYCPQIREFHGYYRGVVAGAQVLQAGGVDPFAGKAVVGGGGGVGWKVIGLLEDNMVCRNGGKLDNWVRD